MVGILGFVARYGGEAAWVPSSYVLWLSGDGSEGYCGCMTTSRDPIFAGYL